MEWLLPLRRSPGLPPSPTWACCSRPGSPSIAIARTPDARSARMHKEGHKGWSIVDGATWNSPQMALISHWTIPFHPADRGGTIDYVGSEGYERLFLSVRAANRPPKLGFPVPGLGRKREDRAGAKLLLQRL